MAARKKKPVDETAVTEPVESGAETAAEAVADETADNAAEAEPAEATAQADISTNKASAQALAFSYNRTLKFGADGEDVRALQNALLSCGLDVRVSGVYDQRTVRAVQQLQRQKGQPASGIIGKNDYAALLGSE